MKFLLGAVLLGGILSVANAQSSKTAGSKKNANPEEKQHNEQFIALKNKSLHSLDMELSILQKKRTCISKAATPDAITACYKVSGDEMNALNKQAEENKKHDAEEQKRLNTQKQNAKQTGQPAASGK